MRRKPYAPHEGPIISREEARALGLTRFFTGETCKHGHLSQRTTSNGGCIECNGITNRALYRTESPERRQRRLITTLAWIEVRKEERLAYGREWARANKARKREHQIANRERLNMLAREARARNPELANARAARYARSPKGKLNSRAGSLRRYARSRGAEGTYDAEDIQRIGNRQKWKCYWCGKPSKHDFHVDHIVPLAKGGSNSPNNLAIACPPCNRRKNATDPIEYARRIGRLI